MGRIRILHLSDLHFGNTILKLPKSIAASVTLALKRDHQMPIDCVVISGDLMDGRVDPEVKSPLALKFLNALSEKLELPPEKFIIVPGNHDLTRDADRLNLDNYKKLLKEFYGEEAYHQFIQEEYYFTLRVFHQQKIAIIGLNSCMLKALSLENEEIEWIQSMPKFTKKQKEEIQKSLSAKKKRQWDDYGEIDVLQIEEAFDKLKELVKNPDEYTLVACFHHHFYPFPEIYGRFGDSSLIRNFIEVIESMQREKVKLVLHGHKHMPIIRPVTTEYYLNHPDSIFYVLSAGSLSCKEDVNRSFQVVEVYGPKESVLAKITRFNYKNDGLQDPEHFELPPRTEDNFTLTSELEILFQRYYREEYERYKKEIYEKDSLAFHAGFDSILKNMSQVITPFDLFQKDLINDSCKFLLLLLPIHYRINYFEAVRKKEGAGPFLQVMQKKFVSILIAPEYWKLLFDLMENQSSGDFEARYEEIGRLYPQYQRYTAYVLISLFFTDLYLVFSRDGETYYKNERINANIRLEKNTFHLHLPAKEIWLESDNERRAILLHLKCTDPTIHKIAVLIAKDFEKRMFKLEDYFACLHIKLYYLLPKIKRENYDLDNLNFEAYIPKLLPLLIGDHLYKNKEVFIRELIQNAADAILLKERLLAVKGGKMPAEEKVITVCLGKKENKATGCVRRFIQIADQGIGMDRFKVERYFTSIGRSFYKSDDFDELQQRKDIEFEPISNFGIGFLSAFMVCKELDVITKSFDESGPGLEIHIPNYDGCFFVNTLSDPDLREGTCVTLYEDEEFFIWNVNRIIDYIKQIFLDFELKIVINNELSQSVYEIDSYRLRLDNSAFFRFFCPIEKEKPIYMPMKEIVDGSYIHTYKHGITWCLVEPKGENDNKILTTSTYLNSGILLSHCDKKELELKEFFGTFYYNLPASYLELDVAREVIRNFKGSSISKNKIISSFYLQYKDCVKNATIYFPNQKLSLLNRIYRFTMMSKDRKINSPNEPALKNTFCYGLNFVESFDKVSLTIKRKSEGIGFLTPCFSVLLKAYYYNLKKIFLEYNIQSFMYSVHIDDIVLPMHLFDDFSVQLLISEEAFRKYEGIENQQRMDLFYISMCYDELYNQSPLYIFSNVSIQKPKGKSFYLILENLITAAKKIDEEKLQNLYTFIQKRNKNKYQDLLDLLTLICLVKTKLHYPVHPESPHTTEMVNELIRSIYVLFHLFYKISSERLDIKDIADFKLEIDLCD